MRVVVLCLQVTATSCGFYETNGGNIWWWAWPMWRQTMQLWRLTSSPPWPAYRYRQCELTEETGLRSTCSVLHNVLTLLEDVLESWDVHVSLCFSCWTASWSRCWWWCPGSSWRRATGRSTLSPLRCACWGWGPWWEPTFWLEETKDPVRMLSFFFNPHVCGRFPWI